MAKKNGPSLRRAAIQVSKIMAASLSQFSPAEQDRRLKAIHKIAPKKNQSKERAAKMLTDIAMEHLSQYSPVEQDARIRAFSKKAATLKKTS